MYGTILELNMLVCERGVKPMDGRYSSKTRTTKK
jgi:hypothetical protein